MKHRFLWALGLLGAACGGAEPAKDPSGPPAIKSMPAYPEKTAAKPEEPKPVAPSTPKEVCAGATPIDPNLKKKGVSLREREERGLQAEVSTSKAKGPYAMTDLDALEKKGAHEELLEHAEDVPPAQRGAAWEKIVEKAASGYMASLTSGSSSYEGFWTSQSLVKRYPFLAKSADFMKKRGEAAEAASDRCLHDSYRGQHCIEMMTKFLQTAGTSPEIGLAFGKVTRKNQNHYVAVPFFKWALDAKKDASFCKDEDLKMAVIAGMGLPPEYDNAIDSRAITSGACWDSLKSELTTELIKNSTGYYRDNTCAVLKAKGEL